MDNRHEASIRAPMILEGLVKLGPPLAGTISAVASVSVDATTGESIEQWFTFQVGGRTIDPGSWGELTTTTWGNRLPFTPQQEPTSSVDLQARRWSTAKPSADAFFTAMKAALVNAEPQVQAGYAIARYSVGTIPIGGAEPAEPVGEAGSPLFRERLYKYGTTDAKTRAHFAANSLSTQQPGAGDASWFRKRLHRGLWRYEKVTLPPDDDLRSDAITDEDTNTTAGEWWKGRRKLLDPDRTATDLRYARFWVHEYRFTEWSQLSAPPKP